MQTPICPACGCSLVRLGIAQDKAIAHHYQKKRYWFCCKGCLELFEKDPEPLLIETSALTVCPVCLAEKPVSATVKQVINGRSYPFCR